VGGGAGIAPNKSSCIWVVVSPNHQSSRTVRAGKRQDLTPSFRLLDLSDRR
jgi:hypothetical protein